MIFKKDEESKFEFISVKVFFLILFLMFLICSFFLLILPSVIKVYLPDFTKIIEGNSIQILLLVLSIICIIFTIYLFCCKLKKKNLQDGLFLIPKSKEIYKQCILIGIAMPLLTSPILLMLAPQNHFAKDMMLNSGGLLYIVISALIAPIFEEVFFRGLFFPLIQSKLNSFWAIFMTSFFFGVAHIVNFGNLSLILGLFVFYGFVLTMIRYKTNSLIPSIITHMTHNFTLLICVGIMMLLNR